MRKFVFLVVIVAGIWAYYRYAPPGTAHRTLAAVGISRFVEETVPSYLRQKLSIRESPVAKRKKLLEELSQAIGGIEQELEEAVPPVSNGKPPAQAALPQDLHARVEKARSLLAESEEKISELEKANPHSGLVAGVAERILNAVLPTPDGVGGDAAGEEVCERK